MPNIVFFRFCFVLDYILGCIDFGFDFGTFKKGYQFTQANHVLLHAVSAWMMMTFVVTCFGLVLAKWNIV